MLIEAVFCGGPVERAAMVAVVLVDEHQRDLVGGHHAVHAMQHGAHHLRRVLRIQDQAIDLRERRKRRELLADALRSSC